MQRREEFSHVFLQTPLCHEHIAISGEIQLYQQPLDSGIRDVLNLSDCQLNLHVSIYYSP
ncbi:MAG: hypothetical protein IKH62_01625 [Methanobrevibacter sp.]|nr:hypothetical protein [Methanobrevibacter sp.]